MLVKKIGDPIKWDNRILIGVGGKICYHMYWHDVDTSLGISNVSMSCIKCMPFSKLQYLRFRHHYNTCQLKSSKKDIGLLQFQPSPVPIKESWLYEI